MKLHFKSNEEFSSWPENIQKGCAGLGMANVAAFVRHCPHLIATHWTVTEEMKAKTIELAERMLSKEPIDGIELLEIGGPSSYANWYKLRYNGEFYTFGLNTQIDWDYIHSFKWAT